jgi:imidazolonepropionase-like amidohydrolase
MNAADVALVGGTIYPGPDENPITDGVVHVHGGSVAAIGSRSRVRPPEHTRILDCSGLTITAGFWNSHVHFFERKWEDAAQIPASELSRQFRDMLSQYGFTSVFDVSSRFSNTSLLRQRVESGEVAGPRIRTTGEGLIPPGALPSDTVLNMMGVMHTPAPEVATPEQASAAASKHLAAQTDAIKIFASSPRSGPVPEEVIRAAADEAHRAGKLLFVHPNSGADVLRSVQAGADIIAHTTPHSGPWDETVIAAMKARRVALTPTLWIWKYYARHDRASIQERIAATSVEQLRAWLAAGGEVLFGTDLGAVDYDPREEYRMMADAGMTFQQILASLTTAPAERFGEASHLGRIQPGMRADIVALRGDPVADIGALTAAQYTLRDGEVIYDAGEPGNSSPIVEMLSG